MNDGFKLTINVNSENNGFTKFNGFERFQGTIKDINLNEKKVGNISLFVSIPLNAINLDIYDMFDATADLAVFIPFIDYESVISSRAMKKFFDNTESFFFAQEHKFKKVAVLDYIKLKKLYQGKYLASDKFLDMLKTLNLDRENIPIFVNCVPLQHKIKNRNTKKNKAFAKNKEELKEYYEKMGFVEIGRNDDNLIMLSMSFIVAHLLEEQKKERDYVF